MASPRAVLASLVSFYHMEAPYESASSPCSFSRDWLHWDADTRRAASQPRTAKLKKSDGQLEASWRLERRKAATESEVRPCGVSSVTAVS